MSILDYVSRIRAYLQNAATLGETVDGSYMIQDIEVDPHTHVYVDGIWAQKMADDLFSLRQQWWEQKNLTDAKQYRTNFKKLIDDGVTTFADTDIPFAFKPEEALMTKNPARYVNDYYPENRRLMPEYHSKKMVVDYFPNYQRSDSIWSDDESSSDEDDVFAGAGERRGEEIKDDEAINFLDVLGKDADSSETFDQMKRWTVIRHDNGDDTTIEFIPPKNFRWS